LGAHRLLDRRQRQLPCTAGIDRPARKRLPQPAPDPPADPRLLAQPDRALLLDRPAQGAHTERLPLTRRPRRAAAPLRRPPPPDRPAVRMDLHPRRPRPPARQDRPPPTPPRARSMTTELPDACTSTREPPARSCPNPAFAPPIPPRDPVGDIGRR